MTVPSGTRDEAVSLQLANRSGFGERWSEQWLPSAVPQGLKMEKTPLASDGGLTVQRIGAARGAFDAPGVHRPTSLAPGMEAR